MRQPEIAKAREEVNRRQEPEILRNDVQSAREDFELLVEITENLQDEENTMIDFRGYKNLMVDMESRMDER